MSADRILVMREGRLTARVARAPTLPRKMIMSAATGSASRSSVAMRQPRWD